MDGVDKLKRRVKVGFMDHSKCHVEGEPIKWPFGSTSSRNRKV